jgi:ABC-2 type transport system ATP-binding protein
MKTALLGALPYRPELLLLDEPFSGLDPLVRDELIEALLTVAAERPSTVLISSHDVDEVERLCDWVGFIRDGRLVLAEPVESLLARMRLVEVTAAGDTTRWPSSTDWIDQGSSGRIFRFVDTRYEARDADGRISHAFPTASVSIRPMSLREIFVALARPRLEGEAA